MSWNAWAELILQEQQDGVQVSCASDAVICGHDGIVWGATQDFKLPQDFCQNVKLLFENQGPSEEVSRLEFEKGGETEVHYVLQVEPEESIVAKKGLSGLTVAKGKTFYVIGVYKGDREMGHINNKKRVLAVRDELNAML